MDIVINSTAEESESANDWAETWSLRFTDDRTGLVVAQRRERLALERVLRETIALLQEYRYKHRSCKNLTGHPDEMPGSAKDWRCEVCQRADEYLSPTLGV